MKKSLSLILLAFVMISLSSCRPKSVDFNPSDPSIMYMGRMLWLDTEAPTFSYPGTTAMLDFKGTALDMKASPGSGYFMVTIDDAEPVKVNFTDVDSVLTLVSGLDDKRHTARIVYAIEGYEKHPEFRGFTVTGRDPKLYPISRPDLKIEFIGNSITCGYGAEADDPSIPFSYDTENHTLSYAYLTGRNLNADVNVVARSGIGIYRNYGGPREGTDHTMPMEYDNTLLYNDDFKWEHHLFSPDIICVNLGTNDTSLDNYDITTYEETCAEFVGHLIQLHPDAKIVLLTGSMMSGQALDDVKGALDRIADVYESVYRFDMSPQNGDLGYGADWHPSAAQHRKMADELTDYLRQLLQPD